MLQQLDTLHDLLLPSVSSTSQLTLVTALSVLSLVCNRIITLPEASIVNAVHP
jgi:hypothetical protein